MSHDHELVQAIADITRDDLEHAEFALPPFGSQGWQFTFLQLARVAAFWKPDEGGGRIPFEHAMEDFVMGLCSQQVRWALLINAEPQAITVGFGAAVGTNLGALETSVRGALPDVRLEEAPAARYAAVARLRLAARVVGCPTGKLATAQGITPDQIERLCRGLFGERWAYLVVASPWRGSVSARIYEVAHEIRRASDTFLLTGRGTDEHHRLARQYIELLEAKLKRLEYARTGGLWAVDAYLLADSAPVLARGSALLTAAFAGDKSLPDPLYVRPCRRERSPARPPEQLTSRELAVLTAIPREAYPGYEVVEHIRFGVDTDRQHTGKAVQIGHILDRGRRTGTTFDIDRGNLTKHGLIVGVTGSGKTNTCFALLDQIWDGGKGVPFLVIESAKSEYRGLLNEPRFQGLRVFTVGDETVSPFRLNPFEVPPGVLVQRHIDYLKTLFAAAFVLYPPMPYVLEQSLHEIYQERGWDLARNTNRRGAEMARAFPTLSDLYIKVGMVIARMGYDDKLTMDVRAGLQARIHQLRIGGKGLMLDTRTSIPMQDLYSAPCILELKQMVSDDEKAFLMGLILIRLYEHYESGLVSGQAGLRHVTLIEEAHRLLRNVSTEQGSEVTANPKGHAIEVFANLLSEIRAYGEGMLIAEQVPTKLTPDAIKNTNLKIVHRLLAEDDRRAVGGTIALSESQSRYLPSLPCGEAVVFAEGMRTPVLLTVPLAQAKRTHTVLSDAQVRARMQPYWRQRTHLRQRCVACSWSAADADMPGCGQLDEVLADANVQQALYRVMAAMRYTPWSAGEAYLELVQTLQQFPECGQAWGPSCVLVHFLEEDLERRGMLYGWSYAEVEEALALAYTVARLFLTWEQETLTPAVADQAEQDLQALADLLQRLCQRARGPFPACASCAAPCQYRFEVARLEHDTSTYGADFRQQCTIDPLPWDTLIDISWRASADCCETQDVEIQQRVALCFAVQQLAHLGIPSAYQRRFGAAFVEYIHAASSDAHGEDNGGQS